MSTESDDPPLDTDAAAPPSAGLTLVATPIGNLADLSPRARDAFATADAVLCEDTRVTAKLLARHGVSVKLLPLHEHNEDSVTPAVLGRLRQGERLVLAADAGTPLLSDPGYRLVRAAIAAGLPVTAVPGANAATVALTLSGLPPQPYLFLGFLPPKPGPRAAEIARWRGIEAAGLAATAVLYEAPHRLAALLRALAEGLGAQRPAAVARELTKRFEEVRRGTLGELAAHYAAMEARGEIVVVIGPAPPPVAGEATLDAALDAASASGLSLRDAAAAAAAATGLPRKLAYARALARSR